MQKLDNFDFLTVISTLRKEGKLVDGFDEDGFKCFFRHYPDGCIVATVSYLRKDLISTKKGIRYNYIPITQKGVALLKKGDEYDQSKGHMIAFGNAIKVRL